MPEIFAINVTLEDQAFLSALTEVEAKLGNAGKTKLLTQAGKATGVKGEAFFAEYPERQYKPLPVFYVRKRAKGGSYRSKFKTAKQQGYFFGVLIKKGLVPYKRSGNLGQTYSSSVEVTAQSVRITWGSSASYSEFVIGKKQNHFLGTLGWQKEDDKLQDHATELTAFFEKTTLGLINAVLKQLEGK